MISGGAASTDGDRSFRITLNGVAGSRHSDRVLRRTVHPNPDEIPHPRACSNVVVYDRVVGSA